MKRTAHVALIFAIVAAAAIPWNARAQRCPANIPHLTGTWTVLPYQMPINPISANLLPTGKVLIVARLGERCRNNSKGSESYRAALWDPDRARPRAASPFRTSPTTCSAAARLTLPDGRALVVGGTNGLFVHRRKPRFRSSIRSAASGSSRRTWSTVAGTPRPPRSPTAG